MIIIKDLENSAPPPNSKLLVEVQGLWRLQDGTFYRDGLDLPGADVLFYIELIVLNQPDCLFWVVTDGQDRWLDYWELSDITGEGRGTRMIVKGPPDWLDLGTKEACREAIARWVKQQDL